MSSLRLLSRCAVTLSLVFAGSVSQAGIDWPDIPLNLKDLKDLKIEPLKKSGVSWVTGSPKIGEEFKLRLTWTVSGGTVSSYGVLWRYAEKYQSFAATAQEREPGIHTRVFGPYKLELDGAIGLWGHLDPFHVSDEQPAFDGNNSFNGSFTPVPPATAVEFYGAKKWDVTQTSFFVVPANTASAQFLLAKPVTDGYAKISNASARLKGIVLGETHNYVMGTQSGNLAGMPVYYRNQSSPTNGSDCVWIVEQEFTAECSNVRVNKNILDDVTWAQLDALKALNVFQEFLISDPGVMAPKTQKGVNPDTTCVIPVGHADMVAYIHANLGVNYKSVYKPYDAARRIYSCVLRDLTYTADAAIKPHHSLAILHYKLGDCGGYSLLITTLFRTMGIPTRIVVNEHHAWNEFFLPWHGWIPCDASYHDASLKLTTADYAYGFGVRRDLANFVPLARGTHFQVSGLEHKWFQAPWAFKNHAQNAGFWADPVTFKKVAAP